LQEFGGCANAVSLLFAALVWLSPFAVIACLLHIYRVSRRSRRYAAALLAAELLAGYGLVYAVFYFGRPAII